MRTGGVARKLSASTSDVNDETLTRNGGLKNYTQPINILLTARNIFTDNHY